jgi:hypothetical protein
MMDSHPPRPAFLKMIHVAMRTNSPTMEKIEIKGTIGNGKSGETCNIMGFMIEVLSMENNILFPY